MVADVEGSPNGGTGDGHLLSALRTLRRSVEGFGRSMSSEIFVHMAVRDSPSGQISVHFGGILNARRVIRRAMGKWIPPVKPLVSSCIHACGRIQSKGRMVAIPNPIVRITGRSNRCLRSIPLVWLSAYFLYDSGNTDLNQIWRRKISLARVAAIAFFMLFIILNSIALIFPFQERQKRIVALIFQLTPVLAPLGWLPFQTSAEAPQKGGHKGVIALHLLHAGYGLVWHLVAILYVIRDTELPARLFTILTSWRNDQYGVYFLLIDGLVLFLSLVYLAMVEHGVLVAISVLGGAFVFWASARGLLLLCVPRAIGRQSSWRCIEQERTVKFLKRIAGGRWIMWEIGWR